MVRPVAVAWALVLTTAVSASAQSGNSGTSTGPSSFASQTQSPSSATTSTAPVETRPATTTFFGDTGLWFVPTGEVLPHGKFSVSGYRRGTNYIQGYTNVGAKVNLMSQFRQQPAALAIRGMVKAPTGKKDEGISTGKADVAVDFVAS